MQKDFAFPEPVTRQGVTEKTVHFSSCPKKARSSKYTRGQWSFRLKEGNTYAYWGEYHLDRVQYYHILSIEDEDILSMLDYWDMREARSERKHQDNASYAMSNYEKVLDEDGSALDPMDQEVYREWANQGDSSGGRKLPAKAVHAIIHSIIERLSPTDQRVYQYMFDENMSEAEIKQAFELKDSAWSEEKKRFLEKVRSILIEMGYDVPTLDEVQEQEQKRGDIMKQVYSAKDDEDKTSRLGKSIAREARCLESGAKARASDVEEREILFGDLLEDFEKTDADEDLTAV